MVYAALENVRKIYCNVEEVYIERVSSCNEVVRVCGRGGGMQSRRAEEATKGQGEARGSTRAGC